MLLDDFKISGINGTRILSNCGGTNIIDHHYVEKTMLCVKN